MGIAVQSCYFSVDSVVPWAEAGGCVVATQSFVDPSYGPLGLDLMRCGKSAPEARQALVAVDPGAASRQVAMIDNAGRVAVHAGRQCLAVAGHHLGEQASAQANLIRQDTVWGAMVEAFMAATGDHPPRPERDLPRFPEPLRGRGRVERLVRRLPPGGGM
ncbi:MAG: DUF1028 domain-containing protein [Deltaproteobacteria bacterium]|nr:DUF1028 domain-containing protein [Deltaproteobacteria bacterium]